MFITAFTSAHHLSLSWTSSIQSVLPQPSSWTSILILSSHLRLVSQAVSFPQVSPQNPVYDSSLPIRATCPPIAFFSIWPHEQRCWELCLCNKFVGCCVKSVWRTDMSVKWVLPSLQNMHYGPQFDSNLCPYYTVRETINTRKMTNAHAQWFLVYWFMWIFI